MEYPPQVLQNAITNWKSFPCDSPHKKLEAIGNFLSFIINQDSVKVRQIRILPKSINKPLGFHEGWPNTIVTQAKEDVSFLTLFTFQILHLVTTLYVQCGHLPEPYELLFCSETTTFETVRSFLLRCWFARKYSEVDGNTTLYCLANFQLISSRVQLDIIEYLSEFMESEEKPKFHLVMVGVSTSTGGHLLNWLQQYQIKFSCLSDDILLNFYQNILSRNTKEVTVFTSDSAVIGKTRAIHSRVDNRKLCKISINKTVSPSRLIEILSKASSPRTFHINISSTASTDINFLLYELLVVGMIHDSKGEKEFLRQDDTFFIELPSGDDVQQRFFVCKHFPQQKISLQRQTFENSENIQRVCKFIQLFRDNRNQFINVEKLDTSKENGISTGKCLEIFNREFEQKGKKVEGNFASLMNYVHYLNFHFGVMEKCGMYWVEYLKYMPNGIKVREQLTSSFLEIAHYISEKSVEQSGTSSQKKVKIKKEKLWESDNHCMILFNYSLSGRVDEMGDISLVYREQEKVPKSFLVGQISFI